MILTSLTLDNFGLFRGSQTLQLAPRPTRPIVLFGGKNGAGKSTIFEAIRLCLYGQAALSNRMSREDYLHYLDSRIHSSPALLIQPTYATIALEFQYADVEALHTYKVTRSWQRHSTQKVVEHLDVKRDGEALDDLATEHWQDFVQDLIPPGVSQLFFFDGEKIQQLAEDTTDQQTLAEAIKSLLGLDISERLQADLGIYLSRLMKPSRNGHAADEVNRLQDEMANLQQNVHVLQCERDQAAARTQEVQAAIERLEGKITAEGGTFTRNREKLLQQQGQLQAQIKQHEDFIRQQCGDLLPFALIPQLCVQLKEQLLLEEQATQQEVGQTLLYAAKAELRQRMTNGDFWKKLPQLSQDQKAKIEDALADVIDTPLSVEHSGQTVKVHQLAGPQQRQLLSWIDQAVHEVPNRVRHIAAQLERDSRELQKTEETLRKIPADDVLKPLLEELHGLHQELAEVSKHTLAKEEQLKTVELQFNELQRQYDEAAKRIGMLTTHTKKIALAERVQKALEEYKASLIEKKVVQLQETVSECFNTLSRKKDALRRIAINPRTFAVTLYDRRNHPLPKTQLSAGEKQIYAISMLWALAKISGRPLPIIIDTPLGRLDSDHRSLLVQHYFPVASHQVLILSTDTEVDQSYFAALQRDVAYAYHLEFDPVEHDTTVSSGYFWRRSDEAHEAAAQ
jgi:DNA sulfur modification protein DndD